MTVSHTHGMKPTTRDRRQYNATIADVADEYGVSTRTVRRWIATGRITGLRIGPRLIRLDLDQVREQILGGGR